MQFRKGTDIPYIAHPFNVGVILAKEGFSDEVIVAGILHDTVEDIEEITIADIRHEFGDRVAAIVEGCSEPDKSLPWRDRKEHTIKYLKTAPFEVLCVTCADKLDNITSIARDYSTHGDELWKRFNVGKEEQSWYYHSLVLSFDTQEFREVPLYQAFQSQVEVIFG
jgi:(p)ppGpp synthase/HD superfamily hydrolase